MASKPPFYQYAFKLDFQHNTPPAQALAEAGAVPAAAQVSSI